MLKSSTPRIGKDNVKTFEARDLGRDEYSDYVAAARQALGLTRPQLATLCRVTPTTVYHWETKRSTPSYGAVISLQVLLSQHDAKYKFKIGDEVFVLDRFYEVGVVERLAPKGQYFVKFKRRRSPYLVRGNVVVDVTQRRVKPQKPKTKKELELQHTYEVGEFILFVDGRHKERAGKIVALGKRFGVYRVKFFDRSTKALVKNACWENQKNFILCTESQLAQYLDEGMTVEDIIDASVPSAVPEKNTILDEIFGKD